MTGITIGSDPEFMMISRHGELVSAIGKVKGTKDNKINLIGGHQMFYDNVLVEVNIKPSSNKAEFIDNITSCLRSASEAIYPYKLIQKSSAKYPVAECQHPDAKVFGCEPEFCAYSLNIITAPVCLSTFRSAGGHIHLGSTKKVYPLMAPLKEVGTCPEGEEARDQAWGRLWVVRMLDLFVGLPSILIDNDPTSPARRELYGNAGTHRPKDEYGLEYRATGNFWLASPKFAELIYDLCMFTVDFVANKKHEILWEDNADPDLQKCKGYDIDLLRTTINKSDRTMAGKLMTEVVKQYLPDDLFLKIFQISEEAPTNFHREWGL
jgi:hypothetical protein